MQPTQLKPFLKWAGGKRKLLPEILKYIPKNYSCYYEPFLGDGEVLLALQPNRYVVNDLNHELINAYNAVKYNVYSLIKYLELFRNTEHEFYAVRALDCHANYSAVDSLARAARIIYLNKTCFNGLYRVNRAGKFNVGYGYRKNVDVVSPDNLTAVGEYLCIADGIITSVDFEDVLKTVIKDSFVYLDPPYDTVANNSFTAYTDCGFGKDDQIRLKLACDRLNHSGIRFLLSNADTPFIRKLYQDYKIEMVQGRRNIAGNPNSRLIVNELLIRNYDVN
ncbi:DNA adenine methylase [Mucilaginibacter sp. BJC16-A38]|uniref:DNA adenine methylase n=1 Tax=Mucilaginibacter phenanthrenivorans TaxID=1234842 RepID=UPI0021574E35|nr:DNA adenine methylase [Mucilaginibacter phenanthrenivorans]MCR8561048.1 DNA adenine methylase [Mucilaginibacter phenanthrenivorans]